MDAAYATAEAMIMYSCGAYPASNGTAFTDNQLMDLDGKQVLRHCCFAVWFLL